LGFLFDLVSTSCFKVVMELKSFATVCTNECWEELAIHIFSLRKFHSQPIYVICDTETKIAMSQYDFPDVIYSTSADDLSFENAPKQMGTFHNVGIINKKMDALSEAILLFGNSLFLDCDIVAVSPLYSEIKHSIMLSPHYYPQNVEENCKNFGYYNAGYVFSDTSDLPNKWREIFLQRSSFYEQEGMVRLHEDFEIAKFSEKHNVGAWRNLANLGKVKSFHAHLTDKMFAKADDRLSDSMYSMREFVMRYLRRNHLDIFDFVRGVL